MAATTLHVHLAILCSSAAISAALAAYGWHRRSRPGALAFAGLGACMTIWAAAYAVALPTLSPQGRLFWETVQWIGIAFVPVFLAVFVLEYVGDDEVLTPTTAVGLSVVPAITLVLVWTNPWHELIWTDQRLVVTGTLAVAAQEFGTWYWINLLYSYLLIGASTFLLLRSLASDDRYFRRQSLFLLAGLAGPIGANFVSIFGYTPIEGLDVTPYSFVVTGAAFAAALFRYDLFDHGPATERVGRATAFDGLADGVLCVDRDRRIVTANAAVGDLLDVDPDALVGEGVAAVLEELADVEVADSDGTVRTEIDRDDRSFDVSITPLRTRQDQRIGAAVMLHETTDRKRRIGMLRAQREELETLSRINDVIRDVNRALVTASTRRDVETAVSRTLESSALFSSARFEFESGTGDVGSGAPAESDGGTAMAAPPDAQRDREDRRLSVPVAYGEARYGTIHLATTRADAFTPRERAVLEELGELIGLAINGVKSRELLVADTVVEVTVRCTDADEFFVDLASQLDCRLALEGIVTTGGGSLLVYQSVADASPSDVFDHLDGTDVSARRVGNAGDGWIAEFALGDGTILVPLIERGARLRHCTAESGELRLEVDVGDPADARSLVDRLAAAFPRTEVVAKRQRDRPVEGDEDVGPSRCDLSDRQYASLEAAHHAGYFEWPRESTAEEVAESMDVSPPTFHNHLRKAERKLVGTFFDRAEGGRP